MFDQLDCGMKLWLYELVVTYATYEWCYSQSSWNFATHPRKPRVDWFAPNRAYKQEKCFSRHCLPASPTPPKRASRSTKTTLDRNHSIDRSKHRRIIDNQFNFLSLIVLSQKLFQTWSDIQAKVEQSSKRCHFLQFVGSFQLLEFRRSRRRNANDSLLHWRIPRKKPLATFQVWYVSVRVLTLKTRRMMPNSFFLPFSFFLSLIIGFDFHLSFSTNFNQ